MKTIHRGFIVPLLLIIIAALLAGGGYLYIQNQTLSEDVKTDTQATSTPPAKVVNNQAPKAGWKIYADPVLGFEVGYPVDVFKLDESKHSLAHTLKNFHIESAKDGSDLGLGKDIELTFNSEVLAASENAKGCDYLEKILDLNSIGMPFSFAHIKGVKYEMGAEGEGVIVYCVKNAQNQNIFVISRRYLHEIYSTILPSQPDFIPFEQQEKIVSQVLNSFKFTKTIAPPPETLSIKVYFPSTEQQPTSACDEVYAVRKMIPKTTSVAVAAINELLKGPNAGYSTAIPMGSKLNSLTVVDGEARADFNSVTESGGGSCSMAMRTAQIRQTLLQFPAIKTVRLSIDGRTQDIFQP